jgi:hypothetical protein
VVVDQWYVPGPDRGAVRNQMAPMPAQLVEELADHGYDPRLRAVW